MMEREMDIPSVKGRIRFLEFAVKNLNDIRHGVGGTALVDPDTGYPLVCENCNGFIFHNHTCGN